MITQYLSFCLSNVHVAFLESLLLLRKVKFHSTRTLKLNAIVDSMWNISGHSGIFNQVLLLTLEFQVQKK